jgi:hypothetical protein
VSIRIIPHLYSPHCLSSNEKAVGMKMTRLFEKYRRIAKEKKF